MQNLLTITTIVLFAMIGTILTIAILQLTRSRRELNQIITSLGQANLDQMNQTLHDQAHQLSRNVHDLSQLYLTKLNQSLDDAVQSQVKVYAETLTQLQQSSTQLLKDNQATVATHDQQTKDELNQLIDQTKQHLLTQIDQRLQSIVVSYLINSLGPVDFSAQHDYIFATLDQNKAALKQDISNVKID